VLFDEQDCRENMPKGRRRERKAKLINSTIKITGIVTRHQPGEREELIRAPTWFSTRADNFETPIRAQRRLPSSTTFPGSTARPWVDGYDD